MKKVLKQEKSHLIVFISYKKYSVENSYFLCCNSQKYKILNLLKGRDRKSRIQNGKPDYQKWPRTGQFR